MANVNILNELIARMDIHSQPGKIMETKVQGESHASADELLKIAHVLMDAWNRNDVQAVIGLFHPTIKLKTPLLNSPIFGEAVRRYIEANRAAFPDEKAEVISPLLTGASSVCARLRVTGTWTNPMLAGPFASLTPTGRSFSMESADFIEIEDGKVTSWTQYYDRLTLLNQIGIAV